MRKKLLILALAVILTAALVGCGVRQFLPGKKMPSLDSYATVVLLPFEFEKPSKDYADMPIRISYAMGTKLKVRVADKTWLYDQSQEVQPISKKLAEIGVSARDVFADPMAAVKMAEAFGADLVIAGQILEKPRFTKKESGKVWVDKSEATQSRGGSRYYVILQKAILKAQVKVVDPKSAQVIWEGREIGYTKYSNRYRTDSSPKYERAETMLADVRKDFVEKFINELYPTKVVEEG